MISFITAIFQFILNTGDPRQTCEVVHRDPGVAGTYYLYCTQMDGDVEWITVGAFVSDAKRTYKATP